MASKIAAIIATTQIIFRKRLVVCFRSGCIHIYSSLQGIVLVIVAGEVQRFGFHGDSLAGIIPEAETPVHFGFYSLFGA